VTGEVSLFILRAKRLLEGYYLTMTKSLRRFPPVERALKATRRSFRQLLFKRMQLGNTYNAGASAKANCPFPFLEMVINCDGSVACGTLGEAPIVGNVSDQNLWEVWDGPKMRGIRGKILKGSSENCEQCVLHGMELYLRPRFGRRVTMGRRIERLLIEPTVECNLDCPTSCGRKAPKNVSVRARRSMRRMPLALFQKIINETEDNVDQIGFFNYGEPFLHPNIMEMITYTRQKCPNAALFVNTNGTLLTDDAKLKELAFSGLDEILFSIDGATQQSYEKYRKGGDIELALKSLERLASLRRGNKPRIIWQYILFKWNDSDAELRQAERIATEIGVDQFVYQLSAIPLIGSKRFRYGKKEFEYIAPFLYESRRFVHKYEMNSEVHRKDVVRVTVKNVGNIRWNSRKVPWGRFICLEVFRKDLMHPLAEERLHTQEFSRDVGPGDSYTVDLHLEPLWFDERCGNTVYVDCFIEGDLSFRNRGNTPLAICKYAPPPSTPVPLHFFS